MHFVRRAHAHEFLRDITKHIFTGTGNSIKTELSKRTDTNFTPIVGLHIKVLTDSLAIVDLKDLEKTKALVTTVVKDTIALLRDPGASENVHRDSLSIVRLILTRFLALCWEESVVKKMAGFYGLAIFIENPKLGSPWIQDRHIDIMKSLVAILKDTPPDTLKNIGDVRNALHQVIWMWWFGGLNVPLPLEPDTNGVYPPSPPCASVDGQVTRY